MKMLYAGLAGSPNVGSEYHRFNCTRNARCQRKFYIPAKSLAEMMLYFDLPFKPTSYQLQLIPCNGDEARELIPCQYMVGLHTHGYYGLFTGLQALCPTPRGDFNDDFGDDFDNENAEVGPCEITGCFYIKASFFNGAQEAVFYSHDICIDECAALTLLEACYNDATVGSEAFDCNGVYYGFNTGEDSDLIGDENLRYLHKAYVRDASVIQKKTKLTLTKFNYTRTYKTRTNKEYNFQSEICPDFWKDEIVSILARGDIKINGALYRVADAVELEINNDDSKLWLMDVPLAEQCDTYFSCKPSTCELPAIVCLGNFTTSDYDFENELIRLEDGNLKIGESIYWEVWRDDALLGSGTYVATLSVDNVEIATGLSTTSGDCLNVRWRKLCACGGNTSPSAFIIKQFGLCECCEPVLLGVEYSVVDDEDAGNHVNVCCAAIEENVCECADVRTVYFAESGITEGIQLFSDAALTIPFTEFRYIQQAVNGIIYQVNLTTGFITATGNAC